ncbi:MAG: xanthine dehydrogenase family protein molybdopterin-binding subunit [Alphaproteobacteria bacterium]|nr:xanthine dehydrogenase family protein molybdopterin-binding subunit [Alphaproteobacteria bacterium]
MNDVPGNGVGASPARSDIREKLTGGAKYIADLTRPDMLHGAILQSPLPHARIRGYKIDAALAVPGVVCVLTGDDFPDGRMGAFIKDEYAIAKGKVRYVGEPVAVVAAEDEATARDAVRLIEVDYEDLPAVLSPQDGLKADAPIIHEDLQDYIKVFEAICGGNIASETDLAEGDVEAAWADCDLIVEETYETAAQAHVAIEPCGALAEVAPDGRITLWSANQSVFRVQANVCESLQIPMARLRCLTPRIGAGFGNKMEAHVQPIVVQLAIRTGRPVKLILSRTEDFEMVRARHPYQIRCKTGVKKDGTFVARELEALVDCGAYSDDSPGVLGFSLLMGRGPYRIPNTRCFGKLIYTNKIRFGAFRGFGNPQVSFATESQIDTIAEKLGMDPLELRLKNILAPGEPWFGGSEVGSNGLAACIERAREASGWDQRRGTAKDESRDESGHGHRGMGVALAGHISGLLATGAIVRMLEDGTVVLNTGAVDIGQGSDTVLTQICASALKIPLDRITIASPDTDGSPYNWGTTASRVTYTTGRAVVAASDKVAQQIKEHAAEMFECAVEDVELRDGGQVGIKGVPEKAFSFLQISLRAHWAVGGPIVGAETLVFDRPSVDPKRAVVTGLPFPQLGVYSFACMIVEVSVDEASGKPVVEDVWSALDVGKAINPAMVEGQIEGGFVQGMGMALIEEMVWDGPRLANPTLMDYKAPTSLDAPYNIHSIIVEEPEPDGPFGAKGAGEIGLCPVPAAIGNAIRNAIGARLDRLPMTPERILTAMLGAGDDS